MKQLAIRSVYWLNDARCRIASCIHCSPAPAQSFVLPFSYVPPFMTACDEKRGMQLTNRTMTFILLLSLYSTAVAGFLVKSFRTLDVSMQYPLPKYIGLMFNRGVLQLATSNNVFLKEVEQFWGMNRLQLSLKNCHIQIIFRTMQKHTHTHTHTANLCVLFSAWS